MSRMLLAHDLGTSGNKASLFSEDGHLVSSTVAAYPTRYFSGNRAEQDPADWWTAVCQSTRRLILQSGTDPARIAAVSFSGHMMGCLCVDREGHPLRPHILWADQRAQDQTASLGGKITPERFYHITGHRNSASYGLQKLLWIRDNEPEIYDATEKMLNAKDWLVYRLTGNMMTEFSDASGTAALDLNRLCWSDEIITAAGIDGGKLPRLVLSTHIAGGVTPQAALETGLLPGTPVVMGGGDGLCATVGAGCVREGVVHGCIGSSAWISFATDRPLFDPQMRTFNWVHMVPGMICPCGTMQTAGSAYSWLQREVATSETQQAALQNVDPYEVIGQEISRSVPGSHGILFLPYLLGERAPRWNPDAQGAFIGIKMENRRADLLRSVLEGITMNLGIIMDIFRQNGYPISSVNLIGGGAKDAVWCQMMADIWMSDIVRLNDQEEATSRGAAVAAGVGIGLYPDFNAVDRFIQTTETFKMDAVSSAAYQPVKALFEQCYQSLLPVYASLGQMR